MSTAGDQTCVILQPSFLPWRGYFYQVSRADVFVFYDDVQYDKHGWRNRNLVKTANGTIWLTIPVQSKGNVQEGRTINEVFIAPNQRWAEKHLTTLRQAYSRAPFFSTCWPLIERIYSSRSTLLADFVISSTLEIVRYLDLGDATILRSSELDVTGSKTERLVGICQQVGASRYLSGPSAASYIDCSLFDRAQIEVEFAEYHFPDYEQLHPPYDPHVSIIDLMMMTGPRAGELLSPDPTGSRTVVRPQRR